MRMNYTVMAKITDDRLAMIPGFKYDNKEVWGERRFLTEHAALLGAADMVRKHIDKIWTAYDESVQARCRPDKQTLADRWG